MLFFLFFPFLVLILRPSLSCWSDVVMVAFNWDSKWYRWWWRWWCRRRTTKIKLLIPFRVSRLKDTFLIISSSLKGNECRLTACSEQFMSFRSQENGYLIVHKSGFSGMSHPFFPFFLLFSYSPSDVLLCEVLS